MLWISFVVRVLPFGVVYIHLRHPDKNPGCTGCQARFTEVAVAYEYLMKKKKKDEKESAEQDAGGEGDEKLHRTTSKDIVDLTVLRSTDAFYPATDRYVWTIMVRLPHLLISPSASSLLPPHTPERQPHQPTLSHSRRETERKIYTQATLSFCACVYVSIDR